jgi:hypothetical protein
MPETRLHIGDRIRLTQHYLTYPAGTEGTITHVYRFSSNVCRVRFDGHAADQLVYRDSLLIIPPRTSTPTR